jgi:hypothetical protein
MASQQSILSFKHPLLELEARRTEHDRWYEFGGTVGGKHFAQLGGQAIDLFAEQVEESLTNPAGMPLSEKENPAFAAEINDHNACYLGHAFFSGYNTFHFFRRHDGSLHIVLADSQGKLLAHTSAPSDLGSSLLQTVKHWSKRAL